MDTYYTSDYFDIRHNNFLQLKIMIRADYLMDVPLKIGENEVSCLVFV